MTVGYSTILAAHRALKASTLVRIRVGPDLVSTRALGNSVVGVCINLPYCNSMEFFFLLLCCNSARKLTSQLLFKFILHVTMPLPSNVLFFTLHQLL